MALTTTTDELQILLQRHLSDWQTQLQAWAASGALVDAATEALLLDNVPASLKDLNSRLAIGDWSDLPKIELLSGSGMGGAIGAWAGSTQTIYLNSDWLSGASKEQIFAVLTEEFGHYLDSQFNKTDAEGDEGELFSSIIGGGALSSDEIAATRSESDTVVLKLKNGNRIRAEASLSIENSEESPGISTLITPSGTYSKEWTTLVSGSSRTGINAIATDEAGSVYTAGFIFGTQQFGDQDGFIAKYDRDGNTVWTSLISSSGTENAAAITVSASGSIFVGGTTTRSLYGVPNFQVPYQDGFIIKYSSDGSREWVRLIGSANNEQIKSITPDSNGGIIVAGYKSGTSTLDGQIAIGGGDGFVARYSADGTKLWTRVIGTTSSDVISSVVSSAGGAIYIGGRTNNSISAGSVVGFISKINSDGSIAWTSNAEGLNIYSLATNFNEEVYIGGSAMMGLDDQIYNGGVEDGYLAKYNSDGTKAWTRLTGAIDRILAVVSDIDGGVIIAGMSGVDGFISKYNSIGIELWSRQVSQADAETLGSLALSSDTSLYVGGATTNDFTGQLPASNCNGFVAKFVESSIAKYELIPSAYSLSEGETLVTTVATHGIVAGTAIYYSLSGSGLDSGDFWAGPAIGEGIIGNDGIFSFSHVIANDLSTEGNETFAIRLFSDSTRSIQVGEAALVSIEDTSVTQPNLPPTDLTFTTSGITENSATAALLGTLAGVDPDINSSFAYALETGNGINDADNSLVDIGGNEVYVAPGAIIDFETNPFLNLNIRVTDNGTPGLTYTKAIAVPVLNANEAPTDITFDLIGSGIQENSTPGTLIGAFLSTDPDASSTFSYELVQGNGVNDSANSLVEITGNELKVKASSIIDFEINPFLNLNIRVTDNGTPGLTYTKAIAVPVLNANEAPIISIATILDFVTEDSDSLLTLTFTREGSTASALEVNYTVGGTARLTGISTDPADYTFVGSTSTATSPSINFAAGSSTATVQVRPIADTRIESNETVTHQLTPGTGYTVGTTTAVTGTIVNDDISSFTSRTLQTGESTLILLGTAEIKGTGNTLNNRLTGNSANNVLNGGAGADNLIGGLGSDTYVVDNAGDIVSEGLDAGTDTVQSSVTHTLRSNVENLILTGTAEIKGTGNTLNNRLTGNSANNVLNGGAGADNLTGISTADTTLGRGTIDVLTGGTENDLFILGNSSGVFYTDSSTTTAGRNDFARITDFTAGDKIQLKGTSANYFLKTGDSVSGFSGSGLYRNDGTGALSSAASLDAVDEFVALIQNPISLPTLSLANAAQFAFVA